MFKLLVLIFAWLFMATIAYRQILRDELQRFDESAQASLQNGDCNNDEPFRFWATYLPMF